MTSRRSILYRETGTSSYAGANILTRGVDVREPQQSLGEEGVAIDVHAGQLWVSNLPDLTKENEAYLEISVITTGEHHIKVPHIFKFRIDVGDESFSSNIAGAEILSDIPLMGNGIEFHCRLTEFDRIDHDKFTKIKNFVDTNNFSKVAADILEAGIPMVDCKQILGFAFNTSEFIDELNDDDRIWLERPKLDLRSGLDNPLYEGWYAFVDAPENDHSSLPDHLYEVNGELYFEYDSRDKGHLFRQRSYFTWRIIKT